MVNRLPSGTTACSWGPATFGDHLMRTLKILQSVRSALPPADDGVDPAAYPLLFALLATPRRVSELAEVMYVDVSTVSRQVSSLVELGLVERLADPDDRRASLLSITAAGRAVIARLREHRDAWLTGVLRDWSEDDIADFTAHLARFADDVERHRTAAAGARPSAPAGSRSVAATAGPHAS
jgi:DNA-binding MarR family transcriptional regulator